MSEAEQHVGRELARDDDGHAVIDCGPCGFAHLWPKPSPETLAAYYAESFYETHSPADWAKKEEAEESYWEIEHRDRLAGFSEILGRDRGALLDIGCGGGWLLRHAAAAGWGTLGIEPSRSMWSRARARAEVLQGTFPDVDLRGRTFDAVNMKLVLEHVSDPAILLREVAAVLRPGGVVCIEVPNDFNPLQEAARARLAKPAWWVCHPVHVNYFSFDSLERLLIRAGYDPVKRDATFPMEWFLLQGVDYIGRDEVGRECHRQRMALESNLEASGLTTLRRAFGQWLALNGIGRTAIVFSKKRP